MVVRLRAALRRPQVLLAKSVVAWRAACSQVEGASTGGGGGGGGWDCKGLEIE